MQKAATFSHRVICYGSTMIMEMTEIAIVKGRGATRKEVVAATGSAAGAGAEVAEKEVAAAIESAARAEAVTGNATTVALAMAKAVGLLLTVVVSTAQYLWKAESLPRDFKQRQQHLTGCGNNLSAEVSDSDVMLSQHA